MAEEQQAADQQAAGAEGAEEAVKKKSDGGGEDSKKGISPKIIIIALLVNVVALIGLAAAVWMQFSKDKTQVSLGDIEASKSSSPAPAEGEAKADAPAAASQFIKENFRVNLAESGGAHFAIVDVEIEVDDDFVKEEVLRLRPKIRDFVVVILSSKTYEQISSVDGRDFLREEIRNKINGYLSRGQIKNIYFTQFIIQ